MDIFKLFFNHDLRLDKPAKRNANKTEEETASTLQEFLKPVPTHSRFYLTGTRLEEEQFGLNMLQKYDQIIQKLEALFADHYFHLSNEVFESLEECLGAASIGDAMVLTRKAGQEMDTSELAVDEESNVGHLKEELSDVLLGGDMVLYKEQAHDGFDLHLFSTKNIYAELFAAFQPLTDSTFRFFSINKKRMGSERHFYFETWTLERPPHGAEEVLPDTVL